MSVAGLVLVALGLTVPQSGPSFVSVSELATRPELIGKEIVVEGRKPHFSFTRARGWNEFTFQGSTVVFRLPEKLSYSAPQNFPVLRARGILGRDGSRLACEVIRVEPLPADLDRLAQSVSALSPKDAAGREAWARWAEARAAEYDDDPLRQQSRVVLGEAIAIEAEQAEAKSPERQLELAERARSQQVPGPIAGALAHRGLRGLLDQARTADAARKLAQRAEAVLSSPKPLANPPDLTAWLPSYASDPAGSYLRAPAEAQAALDRRLFADVLENAFDREAAERPQDALAVADQALARLPDRPRFSVELRRKGLESSDIGSLRLSEVQERSRQYEQLGEPKLARDLLRRWLDDQRANRLSGSDAEGRVLLAGQYEQLVNDKATATALLLEAWALDPGSKSLSEAFLRRGFRRDGDTWAAPADRLAASPTEGGPSADVPSGDSLVGRTREEVRGLLGRPNSIARSAGQGQLIEQWIYAGQGGRGTQYINFLVKPGQSRATVVAHGSARR